MADELRALNRLAFDELAAAPGGIAGVHQAIAERAFGATGARAPQLMHDAIAAAAYGAVRGGARVLGTVADATLASRPPSDGPALSTTPAGAAALAAINGLIGDELERDGNVLAAPMALRLGGQPVAPDAVAAATPQLAVFVHGLFETEFAWHFGGRETYGARLARDLDCAPLYVRYNSGRHVSENGRSLADLLEETVAAWPVEVERIALVGHSMGGLVARSACHQASERGHAWVRRVRHVVTLGTPHRGARSPRRCTSRGLRLRRCRRRGRSRACFAGAAPASAICAVARSWTRTGAGATRTAYGPPPPASCRCSTARRTGSSPRRSRETGATPSRG